MRVVPTYDNGKFYNGHNIEKRFAKFCIKCEKNATQTFEMLKKSLWK